MGVKLRLTGLQHAEIKEHVIAPDGNEAGSLLFCEPVFRDGETILLLKQIEHIPYEACLKRTPIFLSWPTEHFLMRQYEYIEKKGLSVIMLHSHPTGHDNFSAIDDDNDLKILPRLMACIDGEQPHGSAIMLPDGSIKGRIISDDNHFEPIEMISVCGDDLRFFGDFFSDKPSPSYVDKTAQVFGSRTTKLLQNLKIGVVGCSGTGSPAVELLLRYHAGELVLIDFDEIEESNLNRMMASRTEDTKNQRLKVERTAEWIKETGLPTKVTAINGRVPSEATTKALSECDIIFGCVDNVIARHVMNKIACAYPYKPKFMNQGISDYMMVIGDRKLRVEAKWQQSQGSTDKKAAHNILFALTGRYGDKETVLVLDGPGWTSGLIDEYKDIVKKANADSRYKVYIFSFDEFIVWLGSL